MKIEASSTPKRITSHPVQADSVPTARDEWMLRSFSFSFYMTMALTVSFFPLYFSAQGYSKLQIGAIYSIGPLIGIFANLFWGVISDKRQTVRNVLLVILCGQLAVTVILSQIDSIAWLYVAMTAFHFFHSPISALTDSLTMLTIRRTGKSYASFRVWGSLGFAFSAFVFGFVLRQTGAGLTIWLAVGTISLTLMLAMFLKDRPGSAQGIQFSGLFAVIRNPKLLLFLALIFTMSFAHRANDGFLALHLRELGASDTIVGWSWTASALSEIPMFFLLARYGHRFRELPLLMIAAVVYAIRFFLVSLVEQPVWIIPLQLMHSCSFGIFLVTALRYMQQLIPDEYRATGQALYSVVWSCLAGLASGVAGGFLFDAWGGAAMYRAASAAALLSAVGFLAASVRERRKV